MIPEIDKTFKVGLPGKKASLSLSINAIVVLVLAISMLGLGLAFTKTMFKKFGEKLSVPPPDIPASAEEPIVLPSEELDLKHGDEFAFAVNYYNDHGTAVIQPYMTCKNAPLDSTLGSSEIYDAGNIVAGPGTVLVAEQEVEGGEYVSFKFIITEEATPIETTGTQSVCAVSFENIEDTNVRIKSKQIVVKVK